MPLVYDVFLSHAWADGDRPKQIAEALTGAGLRVWFDADEISDFTSITRAVSEGLRNSKLLLAYYSKAYPLRRACQWELTVAFLGAQALGDPRSRVLVINPENSSDHIHPIQLRDAKFRAVPGNREELKELVASIVEHVAALDAPLADVQPLVAPNWYGMTPAGSTRFIGRFAEMWKIHSLLHRGEVTQITGAAAASGGIGQVTGLGGIGKSLLAEEYALHFGSAYPGGVFWLRAYGNDDAMGALGAEERDAERTRQLTSIAERLDLVREGMTAAEIEGALAREIEHRGQICLWIVDDIPDGLDGKTLRRWFAPHTLARTLITTRSRDYGSLAKSIDLSVLAPEEAYQLLTEHRTPLGAEEEEQAGQLSQDLGFHALAVDVTASALRNLAGAAPFAEFRAKLTQPGKDALAFAATLADALPNGHEKSIAQTLLRSITALGEEGRDFLRLASVMAVAPIPGPLLIAVFEKADRSTHDDAEERASLAFKQVTSASLAEIAGENQEGRSVHTLISRTIRFYERDVLERRNALRTAVVSALLAVTEDPKLNDYIELYLAHMRQLVSLPSTVDEAGVVHFVATVDHHVGAYSSARTLYERELDFRRREQGLVHPDTLRSVAGLASILQAQGDLEGAQRLLLEALENQNRLLGDKTLGPEDADTLALMDNLAGLIFQISSSQSKRTSELIRTYRRSGRSKRAAALISNLRERESKLLLVARGLQEAMVSNYTRALGPDHIDTLIAKDNLANTIREQGEFATARKLQEEAVSAFGRLLGPNHPHTLTSMNNLAWTLLASGSGAGRHPAIIGDYCILRLVGEGGMGSVYLAEQEKPQRMVALKVIKPGFVSAELLRRFEREADALGRLQHPGIAQIYEAGTADSGFGPQPYFAMEFIAGQSLMEFAEQNHLNLRARLALMAKICDAVNHAHQRGIIHRDLKPGNILVDQEGQPKILDFGVARVTESDAEMTRQTELGQLIGTLAYMSPEQVQPDSLELDNRSDVYALGVITYELLAGGLPYDTNRKALHEIAQAIQEVDPVRLSSIHRMYRGDVETIVAKALEKDTVRRYASAADLAADIRRYLADQPIVARPPTVGYQLRKFARRHWALVAGAAAVFLVLIVGVIVSTWLAVRARRAEAAANAVSDFLQNDLLAQASAANQSGPTTKPDPDLKVRTALDRAAARIGVSLTSSPR